MPRNLTTGIFTRVSNSFSEPIYGTVIDPTDAIALFDDYDGGLTFNDTEPLILVGSTSGALTILAPDTASGTITLPAGTTDFSATGGTGQFVKQASAGAPFTVATVAASEIASGAALTRVDDTNVTLTLGGSPSTSLLAATSITAGWTGTLAAARLNSDVVQAITNDTNVTGSITAQNLTLGWTGTLAAGRLNANVVQSVVNDTNVTGSISAQALTLGWTGTLANSRLASTAAYTLKGNFTGSSAAPQDSTIGALTQKASPGASDLVLIQDQAASGQLKYATVSSISSAGSVSSIAGNTGAFTLANGIDNSGNQIQLTAARRTLPTTQVLTSGTGATYTTPANCLWIKVRMIGGGGGGAGGGSGASAGGTGNNTTFSTLTASGGVGSAGAGSAGGSGGAASGGDVNISGGGGGAGNIGTASVFGIGGIGGSAALGGGGRGSVGGAGGSAATNSGAGGGGGGTDQAVVYGGGGGGAGGYVEKIIQSPSATYTYTVGTGGSAGTAGTSGYNGGAGAAGIIIVEEHYGS